jgi:hypothetical protein
MVKPATPFFADEFLHRLIGRLRVVERQIERRPNARLGRQHLVTEPAVIGTGQRDLDLGPRRKAEGQHRRREEHHDVDAHRIHPALGQRDVAMRVRRRLLLALARIARDAAHQILIAAARRRRGDAAAAVALILGLIAHHRIVDIFEDLGIRHVLIVMSVDIDDEEILVVTLHALLIGVFEQRLRVHLGDRGRREVAHAETVHRTTPRRRAPRGA